MTVTLGMGEVLRASLPPLWQVKHRRAVIALLEALSLWADGRVCVALSADDAESCFRLDLIDALGVGTRSVFHAIEVVPLGRQQRQRSVVPAEAEPGCQLQLDACGGQR